ncbi:MAG: hypothetical protein ACTSYF_03640, partial [Promethearchaeota archaeon]
WYEMTIKKSVLNDIKIGGSTTKFPKNKLVMFPTTHDLFPIHRKIYVWAIDNLLKNGNDILIVTKPDPSVIEDICKRYGEHDKRSHIEFRFTIGTQDKKERAYWEPYAPTIEKRLESISIVKDFNFKLSISMEPLLTLRPIELIDIIINIYGSIPEIWLGKMNHINLNKKALYDLHINDLEMTNQQKLINSSEFFWTVLYNDLKRHPKWNELKDKIKWKDSVRPIINKIKEIKL